MRNKAMVKRRGEFDSEFSRGEKTTYSHGGFRCQFCVKSAGARVDVAASIRFPAALARTERPAERACQIRSREERGDLQVGGRSDALIIKMDRMQRVGDDVYSEERPLSAAWLWKWKSCAFAS